MFIHNFIYNFKILIRNKALIFWTLFFPIILATFFNMAFSDIEKNEKLDIIKIAVVLNDEYNQNVFYKEVFKEMSESDTPLFDLEYVSLDKAKRFLEEGKIEGYLFFNNGVNVHVNKSGVNETILKNFVMLVNEKLLILNDLGYDKIEDLNMEVSIKDLSSDNLSYTLIEFYSLIAMSALYSGILAMYSINKGLANMSETGKRIQVSAINKFKFIFSSVFSSYIIQLLGMLLLFVYTVFVLDINYGDNLFLVILLSLIGTFAGLALGVFVSSVFRVNEDNKIGIIIAITMFCSFLSGMMGITMKYVIDKNFPIINKINPANMITDGFYSLYYYETLDRYFYNIISLIIFSIILVFVSIIVLRRQNYDSI